MSLINSEKIKASTLNQVGQNNSKVLLAYLNWSRTNYALEFFCEDLDVLSHDLKNSQQLMISLLGNDVVEEKNQTLINTADKEKPELIKEYVLRSSCSSILLKRHCDKIVMSTALVKSRGERQLYLATDFVHWVDPCTGKENQAPLILYPVQLFYNNAKPGVSESLTLYADISQALENKPLVEEINALTKSPLDAFNANEQQAYLLSVTRILEKRPEFSLRKKLAINVLSTDTDSKNPLLAQPYHSRAERDIDRSLIYSLIKNNSIIDIKIFLKFLQEREEKLFSLTQGDEAISYNLKEKVLALSSIGVSNLSLSHVLGLPQKIEHWINEIEAVRASSLIQMWSDLCNESIRFFTKLANCVSLIESAPDNSPEFYHLDHAYENTIPTLQRAKFQYRLICSELESLENVLNLKSIPSLEEIQDLCEKLEEYAEQNTCVIQPMYFRARKQLSQLFHSHTTNYRNEEQVCLKRLLKILRLRQLFIDNNEYKLTFGKLFRGMETDWLALESHISFAQKLNSVTGSKAVAENILEQWPCSGFAVSEHATELKSASHATQRLIRLLQISEDSDLEIQLLIEKTRALIPHIASLRNEVLFAGPLSRLSAISFVDLHNIIAHIRSRFQSCDSRMKRENFKKNIKSTLRWLDNAVSQDHVRIQDVELLLTKL